METFRLTLKSLERVLELLSDDECEEATIRVCEKDFHIKECFLPFISNILDDYFSYTIDPFIVSFNKEIEGTDFFFNNVTSESLIESCSIFLNFFETFQSQIISQSIIPSLILFSRKIFCNDFLHLLSPLLSQTSKSNSAQLEIEFQPSLFFIGENDFCFEVDDKPFKCSELSASILSPKALRLLKNENHHSLKIAIPQNLSSEKFLKEFEIYFKLLFGQELTITLENVFIFLSISSQTESTELYRKCIQYLQKVENPSLKIILRFFKHFNFIVNEIEMNQLTKTIASQFSSISKKKLLKIHPIGLSHILKSEFLQIESEDALFDFLNEYFTIFGAYSFHLFENVYFEYLKIENINEFISKYSFSHFDSSVFDSLSFVLKSAKRPLPPNRYLSKSILEPNNLFSLKSEIDSLKQQLSESASQLNKAALLKSQIEAFTINLTSLENPYDFDEPAIYARALDLFKFLRAQCNDKNPHDAGLITITASSINNKQSIYRPQNLLDVGVNNYWFSKDKPNQWLLFDLKENSFIMKRIRIHVYSQGVPRNWTLEGSVDNVNWTTLHTQGEDPRYKTAFCTVVCDIHTERSFRFFKFVPKSKTYFGDNSLVFYSVEFFGTLT
jgi:hypothetical protein